MNTEQRKAAILAQIQQMTHRQLVRFGGKHGLNLALGDYMKISKADLAAKITRFWEENYPGDLQGEGCDYMERKLKEAFPDGLFVRGKKHSADSAVIERAQVADSAKPGNPADIGAALKLLQEALGGGSQPVNPEQVRAIVRKELEGLVLPVTVNLKSESGEVRKLEGLHHRRFPDLLQKVQAGVNVWLAGPAGTGKTTAAANVAKALDLKFFFNGAIDNEYKLLGFTDAQGRVVSRPFREAFEKGGVYLFDEVDASLPGALLAFNAAMANGHCDFPDGCIERHKDFRAIAAANTYGYGANADYVGRNRMDGAFLDRFVMQGWEIDEVLERSIAGNDKWVTYVQDVRKRVSSKGLKVIISPRASIHGAKLLAAGVSWEECQTSCLRRGMTDEQWAGVRG